MKIGIMQPYFIPYIGYWQLLNAVDKYVIYDDVNYKRGWINRNRILINGEIKYFNIPIQNASKNKCINQLSIKLDNKMRKKMLRTIELAYKKAPFFQEGYSIIEQILLCDDNNLVSFLYYSFEIICNYLGIHTKLIFSSSMEKDCNLRGQDKILSICNILHAKEYYNAIGGVSLYSTKIFEANHIELKFLKTNEIRYQQQTDEFFENLSILDVLMYNSVEKIRLMLNEFTLVTK